MTPGADRISSADTFAVEPTPSRLLAALSEPVRLFITSAIAFSIVGGTLQQTRTSRGAAAWPSPTELALYLAGNLMSAGVVILIVLVVRRMSGTRDRIGLVTAAVGGALGGVVRSSLDVPIGDSVTLRIVVVSATTEMVWFMLLVLIVNLTSRFARNEHEIRHELVASVRRQDTLRLHAANAETQARKEVAEWLHGHLYSELMLIEEDALRFGQAGEALAARLKHARGENLRTYAHSLHPLLAELNLYGALQELALRYTASTTVTVTADASTVRGESLPPGVAVAAYRTCEESIVNAVKHGAARAVDITVTRDRPTGHLEVVIENDGSGRPDDLEPGLGLTMIDTYIRALGGTWALEFRPTSGAVVTASIPLAAAPTGEVSALA